MKLALKLLQKPLLRALTAAALAAFGLAAAEAAPQTRIACLGDSITAGQGPGISRAEAAATGYPAALGRILGASHPGAYEVRGFGASGHSLRPDVPSPYLSSKAFRNGVAFAPDVALVVLGTNDSRHGGADSDWRAHVQSMLTELREANADVRVLLTSPPPMRPEKEGLSEARRADLLMREPRLQAIGQALREVAEETAGVAFVDLQGTLRDRDVIDGVHPNPFGAERIAMRLAGAVLMNVAAADEEALTPAARLADRAVTGRLEGRRTLRFELRPAAGETKAAFCTLLIPDRAAMGTPWLLRSGLLEAGVPLSCALSDHGMHVAFTEGPDSAQALMKQAKSLGLGERFLVEPPDSDTDSTHPGAEADVQRSLRGILRHFDVPRVASLPTTVPMPSTEYRGQSAGWGGGSWREAYAALKELPKNLAAGARVDVLFLGDSITQSLTGHSKRFAVPGESRPFDRALEGRSAVSLGLSGDRTEHLLYRIADGSLDGFRPRTIQLQIGINNINAAGHTAEETYAGIVAVATALRERFPETPLLICGPFPGGKEQRSRVRLAVARTHLFLAAYEWDERTNYMNLSSLFIGGSGEMLPTLGKDGIHVTNEGRAAWMRATLPWVDEQLR